MSSGWIKLHRKLWDNPYLRRPAYLSVWVWLLTHAEHGMKAVDGKWVEKSEDEMPSIVFNGQRVHLKKGQGSLGARRVSDATGVPRGSVDRILKTFKNEQQIELATDSQKTLYTVRNWEDHQTEVELVGEQRMSNDRATNEHVTKNIRSKEEKKNTDGGEKISANELEALAKKFKLSVEVVEDAWDSAYNWSLAKGKRYKNYKAFLNNWIRRGLERNEIRRSEVVSSREELDNLYK